MLDTLPAASTSPVWTEAWPAELALAYARAGARTVPTQRQHHGPLRVQKHFYPEGTGCCQHVIVHPPGGIAGGDQLQIRLALDAYSQVQITSPGAAKWYHGRGRSASQTLHAELGPGAELEWLPQETIVFDGAQTEINNSFDLAEHARLIVSDVVCLGRPAAAAAFTQGHWRQHSRIRRQGRLLWQEQIFLPGGSAWLQQPLGLGGHTVVGQLLWVGPALSPELMAQARSWPSPGWTGLSQLPEYGMARICCDQAETAHTWLRQLWQLIRPTVLGRPALPPRIWTT